MESQSDENGSLLFPADQIAEYAIVLLDAQGKVVRWNEGARRLKGYQASEILGEHFSCFFSPEEIAWGKPQQELKVAAEQGCCEYEGWRIRKDGTRFWATVLITAIYNDKREVRGYSKLVRDVTERNQGERTLRDNEARLRTIVNSAVDGIITISEQGIVESLNPSAELIFGYSADDVIGHNVKLLMPNPYHEEHDKYLTNYRETGQRKIIGIGREVLGRRRDGSIFPVDLAVSEVRLGDRRIFTGIVRDITERKRAEQSVRDSESRHRAIFETAVDGIVTIDERGTIESLNSATERLFGYTGQELIGKNVNILMPAPYVDEHDGYLENYRSTGLRKIIGIGREVIGKRKDGTTFPMDLAVSELYIGGRRMFTGLIHDVTDRKRAEGERDQLLESERAARSEAEQANKAKDEFLAVLSHELRTPLTPVLLMVSMLETDQSLSPEVQESVRSIRHSVELEARLIDDLLDLTRVTNRKLQLHPEVSDLHSLIHGAAEICRRDNDVSVSLQLEAEHHHASVDPARFQQVLWNLLINAHKFTPAGGKITVRSTNPEPEQIRIDIIDTGCGIDPEFLTRMFRPFEQADPMMSRKVGGLGLGLAISKAIVDGHHGILSVQSEGRGLGTTFTVQLPVLKRVPPHAAKMTGDAVSAEHQRQLRILVVEDHVLTLEIMKKLLTMRGQIVVTAMSVRDAMQAIDEHQFDLLVSDIGLPDGSGCDVMRYAKGKCLNLGIAVSGYGMNEDIHNSITAGFSKHLTKPLDLQKLIAAIASLTK